MTALRHDYRHRRGDSFVSKTYAVFINGDPVDLNLWTIRAHWRRSHDDDAVVHEWSGDQVVIGTVTLERTTGQVTTDTVRLETPGVQTESWPITVGVWDFEIARDGDVHTIAEGSFRVVRDVTHG